MSRRLQTSGAFRAFAQLLCRLLSNDNDFTLIYTGDTGSGKSTIALLLNLYISRQLETPWTVDGHVHFDSEDYLRASRQARKFANLILDESIHGANARRAMSGENVGLNDHLYTGRALNQGHHIIHPNLRAVDPDLRNFHPDYRLHLPFRGRVIVKENVTNDDGQHLTWANRFEFPFPALKGPIWDAYLEKKEDFVRRGGRRQLGETKRDTRHEVEKLMDRYRSDAKRLARMAREWSPPPDGDPDHYQGHAPEANA